MPCLASSISALMSQVPCRCLDVRLDRCGSRKTSGAPKRAHAGRADAGDAGTAATYVRAGLPEVAAALAALTGEQHALALRD